MRYSSARSAALSSHWIPAPCIRKATQGNLGDTKSVGKGVFEMRGHFGLGWRMYYIQHGAVLIVMLGGGSKSTQAADIAKAVKLAATMEK